MVGLQVVRHFWERNDIKGAINALRKLPDHSVGINCNFSYVSDVSNCCLTVLFLVFCVLTIH